MGTFMKITPDLRNLNVSNSGKPTKVFHKDLHDFQSYLLFKRDASHEFVFKEKHLDVNIVINNWNIVQKSSYLSLVFLNGRDEKGKSYVFATQFLYPKFYTKEEMCGDVGNKLRFLQRSELADVKIRPIENSKVFDVSNHEKMYTFNDLVTLGKIGLPENRTECVYLVETNFQQFNTGQISHDFSLQPYRTFFGIHNIKPNGCYRFQGTFKKRPNGEYLFTDISTMFREEVPMFISTLRWTFDIETVPSFPNDREKKRRVVSRDLNDEKNIIFSYGVSLVFKGQRSAFTIINIDLLTALKTLEEKPDFMEDYDINQDHIFVNQYKECVTTRTQLDAVYETVLSVRDSKFWTRYQAKLKKRFQALPDVYEPGAFIRFVRSKLRIPSDSPEKYVLASELAICEFHRLSLFHVDQSVHHNGNLFDIPAIARRYKYLHKLQNKDVLTFKVPGFEKQEEPIKYRISEKKIKTVCQIEYNTKAQNIDCINIVRHYLPNLSSYALGYLSQMFLCITADCYPIPDHPTYYQLKRPKFPSDLIREAFDLAKAYGSFFSINGSACDYIRDTSFYSEDTYIVVRRETSSANISFSTVKVAMMKDNIHISKIDFSTKNFLQIADYNIMDCILTSLFLDYFKYDLGLKDLCEQTLTRQASNLQYGVGVIVKGYVLKYLLKHNFFFLKTFVLYDEAIEGGYVIDPKEQQPKVFGGILDFQSLYPSIMESENYSLENYQGTLSCKDDIEFQIARDFFHKHMSEDRSVVYNQDNRQITFFANRYSDGEPFVGIYGDVSADLKQERLAIKRAMNNTKDLAEQELLNIQQLTLKLVGNSLYGIVSASNYPSILTSLPIGGCITYKGRENLRGCEAIFSPARIVDGNLVLNLPQETDNYNFFTNRYNLKRTFRLSDVSSHVERFSGSPYRITCNYGDTDSAMLLFDPGSADLSMDQKVVDAFILLEAAQNIINHIAKGKLLIVGEKVTYPYSLFLKKKMYVLVYFNFSTRWTPEDVQKMSVNHDYKNIGKQKDFTEKHNKNIKEILNNITSKFHAGDNILARVRHDIELAVYKTLKAEIETFNSGMSVPVQDFLFSAEHTGTEFKTRKIEIYNKRTDIDEPITRGNRFSALYTCEKTRPFIFPAKIQDHFTLFSQSDTYHNVPGNQKRIFYEVYAKKLIQAAISPFCSESGKNQMIKDIFLATVARLVKNNLLPLKIRTDDPEQVV